MTNLSPSLGLVPLVPGPVQTIEIWESLRVGDFDRGFEMCASDRDFGYFRFCEPPDRDCQREEGNRNTKFSHHCPLLFLQHWLWKLSIRSWTQQKNKYPNRSTQ